MLGSYMRKILWALKFLKIFLKFPIIFSHPPRSLKSQKINILKKQGKSEKILRNQKNVESILEIPNICSLA